MEFQHPDISQMNANGTHVPILNALLFKTGGSVVEFGAGHYSTPHLYYMAKTTGRKVLSVETNREWNEYFARMYNSEHHKFFCTDNKLISAVFPNSEWSSHEWDVAFVDNGPDTDRRKCVEILRDRAKYIIIHDAEPQATVYGWGNIFTTFPNRFYWDFYGNGTMVVSMKEDCSWLS